MSTLSKIEWTEATWNPTVGCSPVSEGCRNCYAAREAIRLAGNPHAKVGGLYAGTSEMRGAGANRRAVFTGVVRLAPDRLEQPLRWRKPRRVFVDSMSDLFYEDVPDRYIARVFAVMYEAQYHTFQVLTKRPERMADLLSSDAFWALIDTEWRTRFWPPKGHEHLADELPWGNGYPLPRELSNVWLGTSVEDQAAADERVPHLLRTPAAVRFLSCEPLLSVLDLRSYLHEKTRGDATGSGRDGDPLDRRGGARLAPQGDDEGLPARRPVGGLREASSGHRALEEGWVPSGAGDGRKRQVYGSGPSDRVDGGEPQADSQRPRRESPERHEGRQPAGEPRARDAGRERGPLAARAGGLPGEPRWESDAGAGPQDSRPVRRGGIEPGRDRTAIPGLGEDRQQDRHPPDVDLDTGASARLHWVIAGGESGPGARPCDVAWIRSLVDQCRAAGVAPFVKQLGAEPYEDGQAYAARIPIGVECEHGYDVCPKCDREAVALKLDDRKGGDPTEWPEDLRVREFPC